jgi:transposase
MHAEPPHTADQLEHTAARQSKSWTWRRARALIPAQRGGTAEHIAGAPGCGRRAVRQRVAYYNQGGLDALPADRPGRGREPRRPAAEHQRPKDRTEAGPTPADGVRAFHGPGPRRIPRDEHGVELCMSSTYELIHRLGLGSLMPRPAHRKADPIAQEEFRRGLPSGSGRSPTPTLPDASRSGSPTRRGPAGRGR